MANKKKMKRDFFVLLGLFIAAWIFLTYYDPDDSDSVEEEQETISDVKIDEENPEQLELTVELISTLRYKDIDNDNSDIVKVLDEVERVVKNNGIDFKLYLDNSNEVNLYSLPSNLVVITRGLLKTVDSAEQLVALVCHGVGHLVYNHNIEELENSLKIAVVYSDMGSAFDEAHIVLNKNKYSSDMESEAEKYAIDLMKNIWVSPSVLGEYYASLYKNIENVPKFLGAHTNSNERIKILNSAGKNDQKISFTFNWDEVKESL
jgi:predicted Zn-dependent protease